MFTPLAAQRDVRWMWTEGAAQGYGRTGGRNEEGAGGEREREAKVNSLRGSRDRKMQLPQHHITCEHWVKIENCPKAATDIESLHLSRYTIENSGHPADL